MKFNYVRVCVWTLMMALAGFILGSKESYALSWSDLLADKPVLLGTGIGALLGIAFGVAFSQPKSHFRAKKPR